MHCNFERFAAALPLCHTGPGRLLACLLARRPDDELALGPKMDVPHPVVEVTTDGDLTNPSFWHVVKTLPANPLIAVVSSAVTAEASC